VVNIDRLATQVVNEAQPGARLTGNFHHLEGSNQLPSAA
jgi:hypothetical protein